MAEMASAPVPAGTSSAGLGSERSAYDQAIRVYRGKFEEFLKDCENPPTPWEMRSKHADFQRASIETFKRVLGDSRHVSTGPLESELQNFFAEYVKGNKIERQDSLLRSALGDSLFCEKNLKSISSVTLQRINSSD